MYYDYDALRKRAGIIDEATEADRKELEHQFWMLVDSAMGTSEPGDPKAYHQAVVTLLKMVPSPLLARYIKQQRHTDEGY
jgi:hypothetical protein